MADRTTSTETASASLAALTLVIEEPRLVPLAYPARAYEAEQAATRRANSRVRC